MSFPTRRIFTMLCRFSRNTEAKVSYSHFQRRSVALDVGGLRRVRRQYNILEYVLITYIKIYIASFRKVVRFQSKQTGSLNSFLYGI